MLVLHPIFIFFYILPGLHTACTRRSCRKTGDDFYTLYYGDINIQQDPLLKLIFKLNVSSTPEYSSSSTTTSTSIFQLLPNSSKSSLIVKPFYPNLHIETNHTQHHILSLHNKTTQLERDVSSLQNTLPSVNVILYVLLFIVVCFFLFFFFILYNYYKHKLHCCRTYSHRTSSIDIHHLPRTTTRNGENFYSPPPENIHLYNLPTYMPHLLHYPTITISPPTPPPPYHSHSCTRPLPPIPVQRPSSSPPQPPTPPPLPRRNSSPTPIIV